MQTKFEIEEYLPEHNLTISFVLKNITEIKDIEGISSRISYFLEKPDGALYVPILKDEIKTAGGELIIKAKGGLYKYLINFSLWLLDKTYNFRGREKYIELYKLEVS